MELFISNTGQEPIYAQITRQIKDKILAGELKEGDALPSIRLLAKELRISVITTSRAYADLERDGYIYSVVGKGSFVAERNKQFVREKNLAEMEQKLSEASAIARRCEMSEEEFLKAAQAAFRR